MRVPAAAGWLLYGPAERNWTIGVPMSWIRSTLAWKLGYKSLRFR